MKERRKKGGGWITSKIVVLQSTKLTYKFNLYVNLDYHIIKTEESRKRVEKWGEGNLRRRDYRIIKDFIN